MAKKKASEKSGGSEGHLDRIREEMSPGPAPPPEDPATALASIDDWTDAWISLVDAQDAETILLSVELSDLIERTNHLARWCESAGLDSTPLIEFSHAARDAYYAFRPTLPHIPDAVWVLLERLKYRLQPFTMRPITEQSAAIAEKRRKPIPKDEANLLVRDYLKNHPGATASQVAKAVGIAQGRLPLLMAWQVEMKSRKAKKPSAQKQPKALDRKMLESIGRTNDPSARMEAEEAAWQEIIAAAEARGKLMLLQDKTPEEKKALIDAYIRQKSDQFGLSDGDS
jgi:hypothetical protein